MRSEHTLLLLTTSSLLVTTLSINSSDRRPPRATVSSTCLPISVLRETKNNNELHHQASCGLGFYFSVICCLNISPVDNAKISYLATRRADNVPYWVDLLSMCEMVRKYGNIYTFPTPGFPNINILRTPPLLCPSFWLSLARRGLRKKGRGLRLCAK
jgi:hypothetical protein